MSEQNKLLERCLIEEVWNRGNYALVDEFIASDYLGHASTPTEETHGREGYKQFHAMLRMAFPDLHFTIEDQIAEGDRVMTRWTARGTHTGEFQGITQRIPATAGEDTRHWQAWCDHWDHHRAHRQRQGRGMLDERGRPGYDAAAWRSPRA